VTLHLGAELKVQYQASATDARSCDPSIVAAIRTRQPTPPSEPYLTLTFRGERRGLTALITDGYHVTGACRIPDQASTHIDVYVT
jgi:hypothetical protein